MPEPSSTTAATHPAPELPLPSRPKALRGLHRGIGELMGGRSAAAARTLAEVVERFPREPAPAHYLALALLREGEQERAQGLLEKVVRLAPRAAEAWELLGHLDLGRHRAESALAAFRRALELDPRRDGSAHGVGACLLELHREREAVAPLRRAVELEPANGRYLRDLGTALIHAGKLEGARECLETASASMPEDAALWANLGWVLELAGDHESAERCYERAIAREETLGAPYYKLARRGRLDDAGALERLLTRREIAEAHRCDLHFALGEIYQRQGKSGAAFEHFSRANALARVRHDRKARSVIALAPTLFAGREFFEERRGWGDPSAEPVFIIGMPRSGTSLVEQILAAHPGVAPAGEHLFWGDCALGLHEREGIEREYPFALLDLEAPLAASLAREYRESLPVLAEAGLKTTDKAPANYLFLGLIALAFPKARVIHIRRDPRDVALSLYFTHFRGGSCTFSYDLEDLAECPIDYHQVMEHWRRESPLAMLEIRYEELVEEFESHARRLVEFAGLGWDSACLEFHRSKRVCLTASNDQVRQPVYTSSRGRWRPYAEQLTPLIERLEAAGIELPE